MRRRDYNPDRSNDEPTFDDGEPAPIGGELETKRWPVCKCGHARNMHHATYCILCKECARFEVASG